MKKRMWALVKPNVISKENRRVVMKTTKNERNKMFPMGMFGLSLFLAIYALIGCGTTKEATGSTSPGTMVITGIPEEYEGKFASLTYVMAPAKDGTFSMRGKHILPFVASAQKPKSDLDNVGAAISNGEVSIPLYTYKQSLIPLVGPTVNGYAGNDTITIGLHIRSTPEQVQPDNVGDPDAVFQSVTFKNGTANVDWNDAFKSGSITITNIPNGTDGSTVRLFIGYIPSSSRSQAIESERRGSGVIHNNTVTAKIFRQTEAVNSPLLSYTETDTKDILLSINIKKDAGSYYGEDGKASAQSIGTAALAGAAASVTNVWENAFLFKSVQITDGKAVLDFRSGIKQ